MSETPNIVKSTEPLQIEISIRQGENRVSVTAMIAMHWPDLTGEERKTVSYETGRAALEGLFGELTFE